MWHTGVCCVSLFLPSLPPQVSLTNPTDKPLQLRPVYGCRSLLGPSTFVAPAGPGSEATFECFYTPLVQGAGEGVLRLVSREVGWGSCYTLCQRSHPGYESSYMLSALPQVWCVVELRTAACPTQVTVRLHTQHVLPAYRLESSGGSWPSRLLRPCLSRPLSCQRRSAALRTTL